MRTRKRREKREQLNDRDFKFSSIFLTHFNDYVDEFEVLYYVSLKKLFFRVEHAK